MPTAALKRYIAKRDFKKTPEPRGGTPDGQQEPSFVIQKHAASHLHYDFRLEADGVLKSWAVPKGPSTDPQVKRLAMEVEDHPLDYAGFEGVIPAGEYGGGNVIVWDKGTYRHISTRDGKPLSYQDAYRKGHISIWLNGEKLHGGYSLTRIKPGAKPAWLLVKMNDAEAHHPPAPVEDLPESVLSGRKVEEMNKQARVWHSNRTEKHPHPQSEKVAEGRMRVDPMLATLVDKPFNLPGWIYEPKLDGERCVAFHQGRQVGMFSRNQKVLNDVYPELMEALKKQPAKSFIIDGEIVAFEPGTEISSFRRLQRRMHLKDLDEVRRSPIRVHYCVFDILYFEGRDLRGLPLSERKAILKRAIKPAGPLRIHTWMEHDGETLYRDACRKGLEGVIAKRFESTYQAGRSRDWVKFKCVNEQEFLVGGYSDPQGSRDALGALLLGYHDGDKLRFAGKVGTGFDQATLQMLAKKLKPLSQKTSPFASIDVPRRGLHWVEPRLIVQIGFNEWTEDGKLRHPRYLGLREDKSPEDVTREKKVHVEPHEPPAPLPLKKATPKTGGPTQLRIGDKVLHVSNLYKILYPKTGFTKGEMLNYYIQAAGFMLPHLKNRPLTMKRYPNGVEGEFFYEKQAPRYRPGWLKTFPIKDVKTTEYSLVNDLPALIWIANLACLEFHTLLARAPATDTPTMIAFDLDPGPDQTLLHCAEIAFKLRKVLDSLKLQSFIKTSGSKGLHLYIPLNTRVTYDQTKDFAHSLALGMERDNPREVTSNMSKQLRHGKIFIDWSQNTRHKTTVTAYSLRATPEPWVSTPISWDELKRAKDPAALRFGPDAVLKRLYKMGDLFAPIQTLKQTLPRLPRAA